MENSPEIKFLGTRGRLILWINHHLRIFELVSLAAAAVIFLFIIPAHIRLFFWNGIKSHKVITSMLLIFSILAISLVWSTGQKLDSWGFLFFNTHGSRPIWLDNTMLGMTQIGNGFAVGIFALVIYFLGNHLLSYELILGTITLWLLVELIKFIIHRSRPFILLNQARIVGFRATGRSFPSGHTSQVFFMATLLTQHFHYSFWIVLFFYIIALSVGITRMYVGAHYPRDVVAGAILGTAWGLIGIIIDGYLLNGVG